MVARDAAEFEFVQTPSCFASKTTISSPSFPAFLPYPPRIHAGTYPAPIVAHQELQPSRLLDSKPSVKAPPGWAHLKTFSTVRSPNVLLGVASHPVAPPEGQNSQAPSKLHQTHPNSGLHACGPSKPLNRSPVTVVVMHPNPDSRSKGTAPLVRTRVASASGPVALVNLPHSPPSKSKSVGRRSSDSGAARPHHRRQTSDKNGSRDSSRKSHGKKPSVAYEARWSDPSNDSSNRNVPEAPTRSRERNGSNEKVGRASVRSSSVSTPPSTGKTVEPLRSQDRDTHGRRASSCCARCAGPLDGNSAEGRSSNGPNLRGSGRPIERSRASRRRSGPSHSTARQAANSWPKTPRIPPLKDFSSTKLRPPTPRRPRVLRVPKPSRSLKNRVRFAKEATVMIYDTEDSPSWLWAA